MIFSKLLSEHYVDTCRLERCAVIQTSFIPCLYADNLLIYTKATVFGANAVVCANVHLGGDASVGIKSDLCDHSQYTFGVSYLINYIFSGRIGHRAFVNYLNTMLFAVKIT